jgi:hypothetical protein
MAVEDVVEGGWCVGNGGGFERGEVVFESFYGRLGHSSLARKAEEELLSRARMEVVSLSRGHCTHRYEYLYAYDMFCVQQLFRL